VESSPKGYGRAVSSLFDCTEKNAMLDRTVTYRDNAAKLRVALTSLPVKKGTVVDEHGQYKLAVLACKMLDVPTTLEMVDTPAIKKLKSRASQAASEQAPERRAQVTAAHFRWLRANRAFLLADQAAVNAGVKALLL